MEKYMSEKQLSEVTDDIKIYLNEIAKRLWSGHAAVMIGTIMFVDPAIVGGTGAKRGDFKPSVGAIQLDSWQ
jgi:hypothetical protein